MAFSSIKPMRPAVLFLVSLMAWSQSSSKIDITLLQLNDVYEMKPLGDDLGGLARVATLKKQLLAENPNTFALLAGDMLSPSAIGGAVIDGKRLAGSQMVAVMNHILDYMTFGNHEFDLKEHELLHALESSEFTWVSSNIFDKNNKPFPWVLPNVVFQINQGTESIRIGIFGLTLKMATKSWLHYRDVFTIAQKQVDILRHEKKADIVIALTHLSMDEDKQLRENVPGIDLILGGHEHEHQIVAEEGQLPPIYKADANARTVFIHRLTYDTQTKLLSHTSKLFPIDKNLPEDRKVAELIEKYEFTALSNLNMDRDRIIAVPTETLDGREFAIRTGETNLTRLLGEGIVAIAGKVDGAIFNSGSIRIDDTIPAQSPMSEFDVLRILPFGGDFVVTQIQGDMLVEVLEIGLKNKGSGGFLQTTNISKTGKGWTIRDAPVKPDATYTIAFSDFLLTGLESNLSLLKCLNQKAHCLETCFDSRMKCVGRGGDLRAALTEALIKRFPPKAPATNPR